MADKDHLMRVRHSLAHIMAQVVCRKFPGTKLATGPATDTGFFYDFDTLVPISQADLADIELEMRAIVSSGVKFVRDTVDADRARSLFADEPYKLEIIDGIVSGRGDEHGDGHGADGRVIPEITTYTHDTFTDLCSGPHVSDTSEIDPEGFQLLSVAGAYWRGDSERSQLKRIYGTAWASAGDLERHLESVGHARMIDHRRLGRKYDLFSHSSEVGLGLTLWHPKGAMIRFLAERFSQEAHVLNGYSWAYTPHIGRGDLWRTSGHLDFFADAMYPPLSVDGEDFYLKPMSCPFHLQIFKSRPRSYRELPIRMAEYATVYRYELSGTLQGLTRVRGFTQDDAHVLCLPEQAAGEVRHALRFCLYVLRTFGLTDFKAYVSTRPEKKAIGEDADWQRSTDALIEAVDAEGLEWEFDHGGGAFYGPKIDLKVRDSLQREWQLSTVQFDFNLPNRFGLTYGGADGERHVPVMIHRALFGSAERFFAMLIEHYAGTFPLWLAPTQVVMIPVSNDQVEYARRVADDLAAVGMRVQIDDGPARMSAKIRDAEVERVPFTLVVGRREVQQEQVSVRSREEGDLGPMSLTDFLAKIGDDHVRRPQRII
ncbi:threonine--tRNA ligase [Nonomuraea sp. NPDC049625]|uniref:threonine--tRNA ligase n=1 Tax=Nonomuraea sp. NPDC049625 TaxID=3155775 RepID=UPI0034322F9D